MKAVIICVLINLSVFKIGHTYLLLFKKAKYGIIDYCTSQCVFFEKTTACQRSDP